MLAGSYYSRESPPSLRSSRHMQILTICEDYFFPENVDCRARHNLRLQLWTLLGVRARNALFSDILEGHCWVFTNIDRSEQHLLSGYGHADASAVPLVGEAIACCVSPFAPSRLADAI